jgi:hypothetical protein
MMAGLMSSACTVPAVCPAVIQVTAIIECSELYSASLGKLLATRHALLQQLQQQLSAELQQPYMQTPSTTGAAFNLLHTAAAAAQHQEKQQMQSAAGQLHLLQLLDQLAGNLQREHVLRSMLKCFVWGRILDSIQFAKAAVYSHPLFPDVHAIVCVLHKREQQRQQQQQQVQEASGMKVETRTSDVAVLQNVQQQQQVLVPLPAVQPVERCQQQQQQQQVLMPMVMR